MKSKHVVTVALLAIFSALGYQSLNGERFVSPRKNAEASSDEMVLFSDGVWNDALGTVTYANNSYSKYDETTKCWVAGGYNINNNVMFSNSLNVNDWTNISIQFTAAPGWTGLGMLSKNSIGCYDGTKFEMSMTAETTISLEKYHDVLTTSCTWWKPDHSTENTEVKLDDTAIYGFYFWGGTVNVSSIKLTGKKGSSGGDEEIDTSLKTETLLSDPAYVTSVSYSATNHVASINYGASETDSSNYSIKADGANCTETSLSKVADSDNQVIHAETVRNVRFDSTAAFDLLDGAVDQGKLTFKAKFTVAEGQKVRLRIFDGSGEWGERWGSEIELELPENPSEWNTYEIDFSKLGKLATISSWGSVGCKVLNFADIHGIGIVSDSDYSMDINDIKFEHKNNGKKIKSLTLTTTKSSYLAGTSYQPSTTTVDATYEDDRVVKNIGGYTFTAPTVFTEDKHSVDYKVNYNSNVTTETLVLSLAQATEITIASMPEKTSFKDGETIDLTGLKVNAAFGDEVLEDVAYTVDQTIAYVGLEKVVISYAGLTKDLPITVTAYEKHFNMFDSSYCVTDSEGNANFKEGYYANNGTLDKDGENYYYHHSDTTGWKSSRFNFSDGAALNLQAVSVNCPDAKIFMRYKASEGTALSLGLMNRVEGSTWDNAYNTVDASITSDGNWHVATFNLADFDKAYTGHLDEGDVPTGTMNFKAINGWLLVGKGDIEISEISVKWDGEEINGDFDDKAAPKLTYNGDKVYNLHEGDDVPEIVASAYDIIDGEVEVQKIWSENSLDENGKLLPGDHTLILRAVDKADNATTDADYTITFHVEANKYKASIVSDKGTVTLSNDEFVKGEVVTISVTPNDGYEVDTITVIDKDGNELDVKNNQFTAVGSDVTITVTYKEVKKNPTTDPATDDNTSNSGTGTSETTKKGCGGSVVAATSILATLTLVGAGLVLKKKKNK